MGNDAHEWDKTREDVSLMRPINQLSSDCVHRDTPAAAAAGSLFEELRKSHNPKGTSLWRFYTPWSAD